MNCRSSPRTYNGFAESEEQAGPLPSVFVRTALTKPSLTALSLTGDSPLGPWQQIALIDFGKLGREKKLIGQVIRDEPTRLSIEGTVSYLSHTYSSIKG
jgi:hypothetical protein